MQRARHLAVVLVLLFPIFIIPFVASASDEGDQYDAVTFVERVLEIDVDAYTPVKITGSHVRLRGQGDSEFKCNVHWEKESVVFCRIEHSWPSMQSSEDSLSIAKDFLQRYQAAYNKSYCERFLNFLEKVTPNQNQTIKEGNVTFQFQYFPNYEELHYRKRTFSLSWDYTINNVPVRFKTVSIDVSKDGYVSFFRDTWELYYIVSSRIKVSREQAVSVARAYAEDYALKWGQEIVSVDTHFSYTWTDFRGSGDRHALYPHWAVTVCFDKRNDDGFWGVESYGVAIWADTGAVYYAAPDKFVGGSDGGRPNYLPMAFVTIGLVASATVCSFVMYRKRRLNLQ